MRRTLAGLLAAGGLITAVCLGWSLPQAASERTAADATWQRRELVFLKAAYDRMRQDGEQESEGSASLRQEQQRIVGQMAEIAKLLPSEAVPAELRALLQGAGKAAGPVPPQHRSEQQAERPGFERRRPDLRIGLPVGFAGGPHPSPQTAEFAIAPELREPLRAEPIPVGPTRPEPAAEPASRRKPRDDTARSRR